MHIIMKKNTIVLLVAIVLLLLVGGRWWSAKIQTTDPSIISRNGIHWHAKLNIMKDGKNIPIPPGIGLGAVHESIHTHDDVPVIHMEFEGVVRKKNLRLENFFRIWGKNFNEFGPNVTMTVGSTTSTEYGSYEMKDGDIIELRYENR